MLNPKIIELLHDGQNKLLDLTLLEEELTESDTIELAEHVRNSQIDTLDMSYIDLTYNGVLAIIDSLKHSHVTNLTLSYNALTDESATYIANNLGNLTYLDLEGNYISNNGVRALLQHLANSSIQNLNLNENNIDINLIPLFRNALAKYPYMTEITLPYNDARIDSYIARNKEILGCAKQVIKQLKDHNTISLQDTRGLNKQDYHAFEIFNKTGKIDLVWESDQELRQQVNLDRKQLICDKIQQTITNYYPQITHIVSGEHMERDMPRNVSLADLESSGLLGEVFKYCDVADVHHPH